jgi:hypothetical protein
MIPKLDWAHLDDVDDQMNGLSQVQLLERVKGLHGDLRNAHQHIKAHDGIIEATHATLVIQNLFVEKQSLALNAKDNKKTTKRGRHPTGQEWMDKMAESVRLREQDAADKVKRAEDREAAKALKEDLKKQWEKIKEDHEKAVEVWTRDCEHLMEQGVKKKQLPKQPTRPLEPKAPAAVDPDESDGSGSGSDDE